MKVGGIFLLVLAVAIAVVPQLTDCHSQGRTLTLANGTKIDMKCHWTAQAELALALPLAGVGAFMAFGRRRTDPRSLGALGMLLGAAVIAIPVALIGVCSNSMMLCNSIMQPTLILLGTLAIAASLAVMVMGLRRQEVLAAA
jgi:hypothetical protein